MLANSCIFTWAWLIKATNVAWWLWFHELKLHGWIKAGLPSKCSTIEVLLHNSLLFVASMSSNLIPSRWPCLVTRISRSWELVLANSYQTMWKGQELACNHGIWIILKPCKPPWNSNLPLLKTTQNHLILELLIPPKA